MCIALAYPLISNITAGPLSVPKQIRLDQYNLLLCGSAPNIHGVYISEFVIPIHIALMHGRNK